MPIPEDEESSRILAERSHEVVQVTVGVSLPEDRDEPEDDPGEAKALGVGFDEALAGEHVPLDDSCSGRAVEGLEKATLPGDEAVVDDHLVLLGQPLGQVAADEAGTTGDEDTPHLANPTGCSETP